MKYLFAAVMFTYSGVMVRKVYWQWRRDKAWEADFRERQRQAEGWSP